MSKRAQQLNTLAIERQRSPSLLGSPAVKRRGLAWLPTPPIAVGNRVVATRPLIVNAVRAVCDPLIIVGLLVAVARLEDVRLEH